MPSYYGYSKRKLEDQVDWSKIGADISKVITDEQNRRQTEKDQIDQDHRDMMQKVNETPLGDSKLFNGLILEGIADAQQVLLMQQKLLKSGVLNVKDYTVQRQNVHDAWDTFSRVAKNWNAAYSENLEKLKNGDLNARGLKAMESFEGFGNIKDTGLYIDPQTGHMHVAKKDKDGRMLTGDGELMTIQGMENMIQSDYTPFDANAAIKGVVDNLAQSYETLAADLGITGLGVGSTVADIRNHGEWKTIKGHLIDSILADDNDMGDVLTEFIRGEGYEPVWGKGSGKKVGMKVDEHGNVSYELTDPQRTAAKEWVGKVMEGMIDRDYEYKAPPTKPVRYEQQWERNLKRDDADRENALYDILDIYSGDATKQNNAVATVAGTDMGLKKYNRDATGITLYFEDPKTKQEYNRRIDFTTPQEFVTRFGKMIGMENVDAIVESMDFTGHEDINPAVSEYIFETAPEREPVSGGIGQDKDTGAVQFFWSGVSDQSNTAAATDLAEQATAYYEQVLRKQGIDGSIAVTSDGKNVSWTYTPESGDPISGSGEQITGNNKDKRKSAVSAAAQKIVKQINDRVIMRQQAQQEIEGGASQFSEGNEG